MLTIVERVIALRGVSLFAQTPDRVLAEIASIAQEEHVPAGQTVIRRGELGERMYIIVRGEVRVHEGENPDTSPSVAVIGDRGIFGELSVLDAEVRSAYVTSLRDSVFLTLERNALYELMASYPDITQGIMAVLCQRVRSAIP